MQKYVKDYYKSRGLDAGEFVACEMCWCKEIVDIHHIESSFRGRRTHKKDGSNLIWVCRACHDHIHSNNDLEIRLELKEIVLSKLV